jgi:hypothetical protein
MQTTDPLEARMWFKWREPVNWAIVLFSFIVLDAVLWPVAGGFIAGSASIAVMFCVFFFILHKRTIGIECPHCKNYIETNTPWICGVCGAANLHTDDFPFVGRCEHCRAEPKAYQCHHRTCRELIFLTKDKLEINFARCVNMPFAQDPEPVKEEDDVEKLDKGIQLTERMVKKAKLDAELMEIERITKPPKEKPLREILEDDLTRLLDRDMGAAEIGERMRATLAEKYKNDPEALKRANLTIDRFVRDHL